jgi:hypothetical protein
MAGQKEDGLDILEKSLELSYNPDDRNLIARTIKTITEKL